MGSRPISYETLGLMQSRKLILRPSQMSMGSILQNCRSLPGRSAEEVRQIPYTVVKTLSILDFLRVHLINLGMRCINPRRITCDLDFAMRMEMLTLIYAKAI